MKLSAIYQAMEITRSVEECEWFRCSHYGLAPEGSFKEE